MQEITLQKISICYHTDINYNIMKIMGYLSIFIGLASHEEKRKAGEQLFENIVSMLSKPLEETDDEQIASFKNEILPRYDAEQICCIRAYLDFMIALNRPEGALTGSEERYFSKWENIYRSFLEALPE